MFFKIAVHVWFRRKTTIRHTWLGDSTRLTNS